MMDLNIVILAGGKSRRMGRDKGLLYYNGKPFIEHILVAANTISKDIIIVSQNPAYAAFGNIIHDVFPEKGPAGGICTGLMFSNKPASLILSCDIPFIQPTLLNDLIEKMGKEDVLICEENNRLHPLIGIYKSHVVHHFKNCIDNDKLKLTDILSSLDVAKMKVPAKWQNQLSNINTLEQYKNIDHEIAH